MAKLTRVLKKILGNDANEVFQFGSTAAGAGVPSKDRSTLQNLAAYLTGWSAATVGGTTVPRLQELNALQYLTDSDIKYFYQEGLPEYLSTETYYIGSLVKKTATSEIYKSITDNNTGNALSDVVNWLYCGDLADLVNLAQATESVAGVAEIATQSETNTGTDDTRIVTPLKLFGGAVIISANLGLIKLPSWLGGITFQWGVSTTSSTDNAEVTTSFYQAFPTQCYSCLISSDTGGASYSGSNHSAFFIMKDFTASAVTAIYSRGYISYADTLKYRFYAIGK